MTHASRPSRWSQWPMACSGRVATRNRTKRLFERSRRSPPLGGGGKVWERNGVVCFRHPFEMQRFSSFTLPQGTRGGERSPSKCNHPAPTTPEQSPHPHHPRGVCLLWVRSTKVEKTKPRQQCRIGVNGLQAVREFGFQWTALVVCLPTGRSTVRSKGHPVRGERR